MPALHQDDHMRERVRSMRALPRQDGRGSPRLLHPLDDLPHLFLLVEVLVDGRVAVEVVMPEGHGAGVEVAASPAGPPLDDREAACIDEWHRFASCHEHNIGAAYAAGAPVFVDSL